MVQLLPLRDRDVLRRLCQEEKVDAGLAYCLYDGGEITGCLLYDLTPEGAEIKALSAPDEASFDGLVRAVFASLDDIGVERASFGPAVDRLLLRRLGFLSEEGTAEPTVQEALRHCGCCHGEG